MHLAEGRGVGALPLPGLPPAPHKRFAAERHFALWGVYASAVAS